MPFSSLSAGQRITVLLELLGGPKYAAQMKAASVETTTLGRRTNMMGREMQLAGRRTMIANQALYTFRRLAFYGTLAALTAGAAVVKLGYSYLSAMQTARVALTPVIKNQALLNHYLNQLFVISKYSPFVITDLAVAFRQLFYGLHTAGISAPQVIRLMRSITDIMSATGKTGPGQLQKVALALQHMAYAGRLTGYAVNQLSRDGIPIIPILNKYLGITGDQLHNISKMGIPAAQVLQLINRAARDSKNFPGFNNAALRISLRTLPGLLQVVRDSLSQLSGSFLSGVYGNSGGGKKARGIQGFIYNLVKRGGPLDRVSSFGANHNGSSTLMYLNRQITGNSGLAQGFLLLLSIIKNVGAVFARVLVPAWIIGAHALIVFYPLLKLVDFGLKFLADHATIAKYVFAILAAEFIVTHFALLGLWGATKLYNIATLGSIKPLLKFIKYLKLLRTVELAGGIKRLKEYAFATKQAGTADAIFGQKVYKNTGIFATFARGVLNLRSAVVRLGTASVATKFKMLGVIGAAAGIMALVSNRGRTNKYDTWSLSGLEHGFGLFSGSTWSNLLGSHNNYASQQAMHAMASKPGGSRMTPSALPVNHQPQTWSQEHPADSHWQPIQVVVDRKVLADTVARANQDKRARR